MWISRYVWNSMREEIEHLRGMIGQRDVALDAANEANAHWIAENGHLRERLIAAEGAARGARALTDSFTIQLNKLQAERDQLFVKVLDPTHPVEVRTPIVGQMARIPGSADLFSDPAEHQPGLGGHGEEIPVDPGVKVEDLDGGLPGGVFEPAAADVHKL